MFTADKARQRTRNKQDEQFAEASKTVFMRIDNAIRNGERHTEFLITFASEVTHRLLALLKEKKFDASIQKRKNLEWGSRKHYVEYIDISW